MTEPDVLVLETATGSGALEAVNRTLDEFWAAHAEVPDRTRMLMGVAAGEIAANIIEHAGNGRPIRMRMELRAFPTQIEIAFTDDGDPAGVDLDNVAMPGHTAERGRGLALAHAVLAKLSYHRNHVGNHWLLVSETFAE